MPRTETPSVLLTLPHYGQVHAAAMLGLFHQPQRSVRVAAVMQSGSSFLCGAFNDPLCQALNLRAKGQITHFAMIHADVEPLVPDWLDLLADIMAARRDAVVSCVIAIKNVSGETSTAIGDASDRWTIKGKIRLSDRADLPETFGPEDVCDAGEVLLINTGLWLADLRHPFWDSFGGFTTHAKIHRDADGTWKARQRTEDWELSHDLAEAGVPYSATWAVPVRHHGDFGWPNRID